jgi:hypothetical protein
MRVEQVGRVFHDYPKIYCSRMFLVGVGMDVRKVMALTLMMLMLIPMTAVITSSQQTVGVRDRALLLQNMLRNVLTLNISSELKSEIEGLVSTNTSALSDKELEGFIERCEGVLSRVREEVRVRAGEGVSDRYNEGLKRSLEVRVRTMERLYGVPIEEVGNISKAKNISELMTTLKVINSKLDGVRAKNFSEAMERRVEDTLRKPDVVGVERSVQELDKVVGVLNRVVSRLEGLGVPTVPIEALKNAIVRISITKELLGNLSKELRGVPQPKPEVVREFINKSVGKYSIDVEELKEEVEELRNVALEHNLTQVLDKIEGILERLDNLTNALQSVNYSSIKDIVNVLASVRAEIPKIRDEISKSLGEVPVRNIDKAFNTTLERDRELLREVNETLKYIKDRLDSICPQTTNVTTICKFVNLTTIQHYEEIIKSLNKSLEEAVNTYRTGDRIKALHMVLSVGANLSRIKAWLEPIHNILKHLEVKGVGVSNAIKSLMDNLTTRLEKIVKYVGDITKKVDEMREGPKKSMAKKLLDDVVRDVNESKNLLTLTQKSLSEGREAEATSYLSKLQGLVTSLETRIAVLEKLISS